MTAEPTYFGLSGLDRALEHFADFDDGVFFEAGANDGLNQSNTAYFEFNRNWTGVLVEPILYRVQQCFHNRPKSQVVWGALMPPEERFPTVALTYCDLMTVTKSDELLVNAEEHVAVGTQFLFQEQPRAIEAPRRLLSGILYEAGIRHVDLFSLDVEGFELAALRGLDLEAFDIRRLCVETLKPDEVKAMLGSRYRLEKQLTFHDYLFIKDGH